MKQECAPPPDQAAGSSKSIHSVPLTVAVVVGADVTDEVDDVDTRCVGIKRVVVVVTEDETTNAPVVVSSLVVIAVDVWSCVVLPIKVPVDVTGACDVDRCFQTAQSGHPPCVSS